MRTKLLVCGYGAGRSSTGSPDIYRDYRVIDSTYSLFAYEQTLLDAELTLRRLEDFLGEKKYKSTIIGIKRVLDLGEDDKIGIGKGGGLFVSGKNIGQQIPLQAWADGYRLTFAWLLDLYGWAMRADCVTGDGRIRGIALIDEIEQHLHPSMQTGLLKKLRFLLPELQIITTTHSPLVTLGAASSEIVTLNRKGMRVTIGEPIPELSAYSAEDVLIDHRLFDTDVYTAEINKMLAQYRELSAVPKDRLTKTQKRHLKALTMKLINRQIPEVSGSQMAHELRQALKDYLEKC